MNTLSIKSGQGDYQVDFYDSIQDLILDVSIFKPSLVVIDENVDALYHKELLQILDSLPVLKISATEENKTLVGVEKVLAFFQKNNLTRSSVVLAIGGGIIQDIVTFSSHIYYRGIQWLYIPTTLLSMGDSCIGAKCGINLNLLKNQLGVFHSPAHVFICSKFMQTLADRDILSGYGEMLKLTITGSEELFLNYQSAFQNGLPTLSDANDFIYNCLKVKKQVIEFDEYERDYRRILNYGHTFGHALEALTNYEVPHGSAVAWGVDLANYIGWHLQITNEGDFWRIHTFINKFFRFKLSSPIKSKDLVNIARHDKKVSGSKVNLILLSKLGSLQIVPVEFDAQLYNLVDSFIMEHHVIYWD